jgi:16S rRNA (cytosine967-C5)-methyltransferase
MSPVRLAAARVLLSVERGRTTLGAEMERARTGDLDTRDRGLLFELVAGTLRWQGEIDAIIAAIGGRGVADLDAPVRCVLRLGVFQIRHLDRVPAHAIVHESVETVRALAYPRAAGFVNAVLRSTLRAGRALRLPPRPGPGASRTDQVAFLSVTMSHPRWLVERWLDRVGFEAAEQWVAFNNRSPDTAVRPTGTIRASDRDEFLARLRGAGVAAEPAPFGADAIRLPPGQLGKLPEDLRAGLTIQDEGAQLVAEVADVRSGQRVFDVCAAPGGKSLIFGENLDGAGLLVASDLRPQRVDLLRRTLARTVAPFSIVQLDATRPVPFGAVFDRVVVDAPCSGLGTLRRDPDLKWSRQPDDLPALAAIELRILTAAAEAVRPEGRLIYATCSSEPEENDEVVAAFLASDSRFERRPIELAAGLPASLVDEQGCLATLPPRDGLDAYFAAVLVRRQAT